MSDKEKDMLDDGEDLVVVMTDEDGNEFYYSEELIIPVGDDKYALLVAIEEDGEEAHEHEHGCDCGCEEADVVIAKIVKNADGEEEYVEPTDEEFELVQKAYDEMMDAEEE